MSDRNPGGQSVSAPKRGVVRGTAVNLAATAITMVVGFVTTPFFVDRLGAEAYGVYALVVAFSMAGFLGQLDLGIQAATVQRSGAYSARAARPQFLQTIASSGLLLAGLGAVVGACLVLFSVLLAERAFNLPSHLEHVFRTALLLLAAAAAVQYASLALQAALQTAHRYDLVVFQRALSSLVGVGTAVALVAAGAGPEGLVYPVVLAPLVGVVLLVFLTADLAVLRSWPKLASRREMATLARAGWLFFAAQAGVVVVANADQVIIAATLSTVDLAKYAIAAVPYYAVFALMAITNATVFAAAVHFISAGDEEATRRLFLRGTRYAATLVLCGGTAGFLWGPRFIVGWVGPEFAESGAILRIWLAHFALTAFTGVAWNMLAAVGRLPAAARIAFLSAGINVAASLALVGALGVRGVVVGTVVAYVVTGPLVLRHVLDATETRVTTLVRESVLPAATSVAVATATGLLLLLAARPSSLAAVIAAGLATFAAGVVAGVSLMTQAERADVWLSARGRLGV